MLASVASIDSSLAPFCPSESSLFDTLDTKGMLEIKNKAFLKKDFQEIYNNFDHFIAYAETDPSFIQSIDMFESEYLSHVDIKNRYCSAPPSFRDPKKNLQKRFDKVYFQFIRDHYDLAMSNHPEIFANKPEVVEFLDGMRKLDEYAKEQFSKIIDEIEKEKPGFKALIYGKQKELTVISQIVRYNQTESWGTTPHRDKSALTFIWDSTDKNDESLILCPDTHNPSTKGLILPRRQFSQKEDCTSTILIPGLSLQKVGFPLAATVHGVLGFKAPHRHALISFLLVPDIDRSSVVADFKD